MKAVQSSSQVSIVLSLSSSSHVFASLVSDRGNIIRRTASFSESKRQHGRQPTWVHHPWIVISNDIKKLTKVIDVKNWRVDNSRILLGIVSLIVWNSSVSSMKSSIQRCYKGVSTPNLSALKRFRRTDDPSLTLEEVAQMMEEENRLADLKAANVKSKKALKKLTRTQRMA
nr:hypothetical protein [Tanacetum cinerariifolium]